MEDLTQKIKNKDLERKSNKDTLWIFTSSDGWFTKYSTSGSYEDISGVRKVGICDTTHRSHVTTITTTITSLVPKPSTCGRFERGLMAYHNDHNNDHNNDHGRGKHSTGPGRSPRYVYLLLVIRLQID